MIPFLSPKLLTTSSLGRDGQAPARRHADHRQNLGHLVFLARRPQHRQAVQDQRRRIVDAKLIDQLPFILGRRSLDDLGSHQPIENPLRQRIGEPRHVNFSILCAITGTENLPKLTQSRRRRITAGHLHHRLVLAQPNPARHRRSIRSRRDLSHLRHQAQHRLAAAAPCSPRCAIGSPAASLPSTWNSNRPVSPSGKRVEMLHEILRQGQLVRVGPLLRNLRDRVPVQLRRPAATSPVAPATSAPSRPSAASAPSEPEHRRSPWRRHRRSAASLPFRASSRPPAASGDEMLDQPRRQMPRLAAR